MGLAGSFVALMQFEFFAVLWVILRPYSDTNFTEQLLLYVYLFAALLAFSGSFVSYFKPLVGGAVLLLAGAAPLPFDLLVLYASGSKYGGGPWPLLWTPVLAMEITAPVFLVMAGVLARSRKKSGSGPSTNRVERDRDAGSPTLPA